LSPLVVVGLVLLLAVVALNWATLQLLKPKRAPIERTPLTMGLDAEEIEFKSDGRTLRGWFLNGAAGESGCAATEAAAAASVADADQTRPLVILAHGWGANTGAVLPLGAAFVCIGFDVLTFDFRHHGRSDDAPRVTMLDYAQDLDAGVSYAKSRFPGRRIVLVGHSMGGAAAILAAADGTEADGLLLVATPADFFDVTANYLGGGVTGLALLVLTAPFFFLHVRKWWTSIAPDRHIRDVNFPISIVQGDRDRRVPPDHVYRLAKRAGVDPLILDDTGHVDILYNEVLHRHAIEFVNSLR
jgi:pimeloyl-ACP methyl ester carboxylesterase